MPEPTQEEPWPGKPYPPEAKTRPPALLAYPNPEPARVALYAKKLGCFALAFAMGVVLAWMLLFALGSAASLFASDNGYALAVIVVGGFILVVAIGVAFIFRRPTRALGLGMLAFCGLLLLLLGYCASWRGFSTLAT